MKQKLAAGLMLATFVTFSAAAQDWYHDRDGRFQGDQWRAQVFTQVRADLDHIYAPRASEKEDVRLQRTKEELTDLQARLDHGQFDNGILNDVIDSLKKSAHDNRLAPRDREIVADDRVRLENYQRDHKHWVR